MVSQSALPHRALGRTGLQASILGFGTAPLGDLFLQLDDQTAIAAAARALELGINLLDTSPLYGYGLSEHRCGTALRRVPRRDVVLCCKVGRWMDPFHRPDNRSGFVGGQPHRAVVDYSYDGTMRSVEQTANRSASALSLSWSCSGFTHITARRIAQSPYPDLSHEAPTQPVTRPSCSLATGPFDGAEGTPLHIDSAAADPAQLFLGQPSLEEVEVRWSRRDDFCS